MSSQINAGTALAFFALLGMPFLFAAAGFVVGIVIATIYNIAAKWFGGIEMEIIEIEDNKKYNNIGEVK